MNLEIPCKAIYSDRLWQQKITHGTVMHIMRLYVHSQCIDIQYVHTYIFHSYNHVYHCTKQPIDFKATDRLQATTRLVVEQQTLGNAGSNKP